MEDKNSTANKAGGRTISVAVIGGAIIAVLLILSTLWINQRGQDDTSEAVHSVSEMYLRELTDRREQVITARINVHVDNIKSALRIVMPADLQSVGTLSAFLGKMRTFCSVDQFAFVDANGTVFTPAGIYANPDNYSFANETFNASKVLTFSKTVIVVVPVENVTFQGVPIKNAFIQLSMSKFLSGILVHTTTSGMTFFNLYYTNGDSLTDAVLGSLDSGTNLLEALSNATFEKNYSIEKIKTDFAKGKQGGAAFTYRGAKETLYYRPVGTTGWMLTYLIRENKIEDEIAAVSDDIRRRSLIQIGLTVLAVIVVFTLIITQARKNTQLMHQKNLSETESRVKREEMEEKFRLQTQLLSEERRRRRQSEMIQALTVDYRLVYHLNLDSDEAVCYRVEPEVTEQLGRKQSDVVRFQEAMQNYVATFVAPNDREDLLNFVDPRNIRARLANEEIISHPLRRRTLHDVARRQD